MFVTIRSDEDGGISVEPDVVGEALYNRVQEYPEDVQLVVPFYNGYRGNSRALGDCYTEEFVDNYDGDLIGVVNGMANF